MRFWSAGITVDYTKFVTSVLLYTLSAIFK